jgi:uncharacterized membrane protein YidH (DUF202 family)
VTQRGPAEPPEDIEDAVPGLARERTELAWTRSSIAFAALGAAILKLRPAAGAPILVFSVVIWSRGRVRRDEAGTAARRVLLVTIAVTLLAAVALVLAILGHSSHGIRL